MPSGMRSTSYTSQNPVQSLLRHKKTPGTRPGVSDASDVTPLSTSSVGISGCTKAQRMSSALLAWSSSAASYPAIQAARSGAQHVRLTRAGRMNAVLVVRRALAVSLRSDLVLHTRPNRLAHVPRPCRHCVRAIVLRVLLLQRFQRLPAVLLHEGLRQNRLSYRTDTLWSTSVHQSSLQSGCFFHTSARRLSVT